MPIHADIYERDRTHEPGNATRYDLSLMHDRDSLYVFTWLNAPGHGRACTLNKNSYVHEGYLAEKLGYDNAADLAVIRAWLSARGFDC